MKILFVLGIVTHVMSITFKLQLINPKENQVLELKDSVTIDLKEVDSFYQNPILKN